MTICKHCKKPLEWGRDHQNERFVPLIPINDHDSFDKTFQDENGVLRATHWQVCTQRRAIGITKLARPVKGKKPKTYTDPDTGEILFQETETA